MKSGALTGNLMVLTTILIYSFNTNFMKVLMPEWIEAQGLVLARCTVSLIGFWIHRFFYKRKIRQQTQTKRYRYDAAGRYFRLGRILIAIHHRSGTTGPVDAFCHPDFSTDYRTGFSPLFFWVPILPVTRQSVYCWGCRHPVRLHYASQRKRKRLFHRRRLVLAATICNSFFLILIKPYTQKFNAFTVMKWMSLSAFIVALPFGYRQLALPIYSPWGSFRANLV